MWLVCHAMVHSHSVDDVLWLIWCGAFDIETDNTHQLQLFGGSSVDFPLRLLLLLCLRCFRLLLRRLLGNAFFASLFCSCSLFGFLQRSDARHFVSLIVGRVEMLLTHSIALIEIQSICSCTMYSGVSDCTMSRVRWICSATIDFCRMKNTNRGKKQKYDIKIVDLNWEWNSLVFVQWNSIRNIPESVNTEYCEHKFLGNRINVISDLKAFGYVKRKFQSTHKCEWGNLVSNGVFVS